MPVAEYELHELDWDTQFFGMKMGQVLLPAKQEPSNFSELTWLHTLEMARHQKYYFLYCPIDVAYPEAATIIAGHGAIIGDILVTFVLNCSKGIQKINSHFKIKDATYEDLPGILDIAATSFRDSRFMTDPHFDRGKAEQFYPSWLKESFSNSEKILVVKEKGQVLGFISLKPDPLTETLVIRLIAVKSSEQGKGIGQLLVHQGINLATDLKYQHVQVGTQLTNTAAINLYERNGFRMVNAKYRYHIWLNKIFQLHAQASEF
jgi:ribosomal protein S18 acetylase RimI-like enzyme